MADITPLIQQYTVDFASNNNFVFVKAVQGDGHSTRYIDITLMNNGQPYEVDTNEVRAVIRGTKPDGMTIYNDCEILDNNTIRVEITEQISAVAGKGNYEISIMSLLHNRALTSFPFYIVVSASSFETDRVTSSNEYLMLVNKINQVDKVNREADALIAEQEVLKAELEAAEKVRNTAENERKSNEGNRQKEETLRVDAENKRVDAEDQRIANENIRIETENQRNTDEDVRKANEESRVEAENIRIATENQRIVDENIRISNENERRSNEEARIQQANDFAYAESVRVENESARQTSESNRVNAENIRVDSENQRNTDEDIRKSNESSRVESENTRRSNDEIWNTNENIREENEDQRIANENIRIEAENNRVKNENIRIEAENARIQQANDFSNAEDFRIENENTRQSNEETRQSNEETRQNNESTRNTSEDGRVEAEDTRLSNEEIRISNEDARIVAETDRVDAENIRVENENKRITDEKARQTNETARIEQANTFSEAELLRESNEELRNNNETERLSNEEIRMSNEEQRIANEEARQINVETAIQNAESTTNQALEAINLIQEGVHINDNPTEEQMPLVAYSAEKVNALATEIDAELNNKVRYQKSEEKGWHVTNVCDTLNMFQQFSENTPVTELIKNENVIAHYTTDFINKMLPYPIRDGVITGTCDEKLGFMTNAYIKNKCLAKLKYLFFNHTTGDESVGFVNNIQINGIRALPPTTPTYEIKDKRNEAVEIAKSYYDARINGRKFSYGSNFITYTNTDVVNDENGGARFECDTLVSLVMLGIPYESSPYIDTTPDLTYNFDDLVINPNGFSWCLPWKYNDILNRKITYTGVQNWYLWYNNLVFSDINNIASGDIVIFTKQTSKYFDGISHIGIIDINEENGNSVPYIYHMSSDLNYEPLQDVIDRDKNRNIYFARPNYE